MLELFPDVLTVKQVQGILQIGRTQTYSLVHTGRLRAIRIGNTIRIPKTELLEFIGTSRYNNGEVDRHRYHEGGSNEDNR